MFSVEILEYPEFSGVVKVTCIRKKQGKYWKSSYNRGDFVKFDSMGNVVKWPSPVFHLALTVGHTSEKTQIVNKPVFFLAHLTLTFYF